MLFTSTQRSTKKGKMFIKFTIKNRMNIWGEPYVTFNFTSHAKDEASV